jgi:uncharacterized protein (DUF1697 family)
MSTHIALLRAVNVGGTGKLPMAELRAIAEGLGYGKVRSYIASGNLLVDSRLAADRVREQLEAALAERMGKPVGVVLRSAAELDALIAANPFPDAAPNRVIVSLLNETLPFDAAAGVRHQKDEQIVWAPREVYVFYGEGMRDSKLRIPAAEAGTARNLNTLRALLEMASG